MPSLKVKTLKYVNAFMSVFLVGFYMHIQHTSEEITIYVNSTSNAPLISRY